MEAGAVEIALADADGGVLEDGAEAVFALHQGRLDTAQLADVPGHLQLGRAPVLPGDHGVDIDEGPAALPVELLPGGGLAERAILQTGQAAEGAGAGLVMQHLPAGPADGVLAKAQLHGLVHEEDGVGLRVHDVDVGGDGVHHRAKQVDGRFEPLLYPLESGDLRGHGAGAEQAAVLAVHREFLGEEGQGRAIRRLGALLDGEALAGRQIEGTAVGVHVGGDLLWRRQAGEGLGVGLAEDVGGGLAGQGGIGAVDQHIAQGGVLEDDDMFGVVEQLAEDGAALLALAALGDIEPMGEKGAVGQGGGDHRPPAHRPVLAPEGQFAGGRAEGLDPGEVGQPLRHRLGRQEFMDMHGEELVAAVAGDVAGLGVDVEVAAIGVDDEDPRRCLVGIGTVARLAGAQGPLGTAPGDQRRGEQQQAEAHDEKESQRAPDDKAVAVVEGLWLADHSGICGDQRFVAMEAAQLLEVDEDLVGAVHFHRQMARVNALQDAPYQPAGRPPLGLAAHHPPAEGAMADVEVPAGEHRHRHDARQEPHALLERDGRAIVLAQVVEAQQHGVAGEAGELLDSGPLQVEQLGNGHRSGKGSDAGAQGRQVDAPHPGRRGNHHQAFHLGKEPQAEVDRAGDIHCLVDPGDPLLPGETLGGEVVDTAEHQWQTLVEMAAVLQEKGEGGIVAGDEKARRIGGVFLFEEMVLQGKILRAMKVPAVEEFNVAQVRHPVEGRGQAAQHPLRPAILGVVGHEDENPRLLGAFIGADERDVEEQHDHHQHPAKTGSHLLPPRPRRTPVALAAGDSFCCWGQF